MKNITKELSVSYTQNESSRGFRLFLTFLGIVKLGPNNDLYLFKGSSIRPFISLTSTADIL